MIDEMLGIGKAGLDQLTGAQKLVVCMGIEGFDVAAVTDDLQNRLIQYM